MKDIIIILMIVLIIFVGGIYTKRYLQVSSDEVIVDLKNLREGINVNNINELKETVGKIYSKWENTNKKWSIIILHNELDLIEISLISIKSNIETENYKKSIEEIDKCIYLLEHIIGKEKFNLKNIF